VSEHTSRPSFQLELKPIELTQRASVEEGWTQAIQARIKTFLRTNRLALLTIILPVTCVTIYYSLIAADIYVSEAHFIVRSKSTASMSGALAATSVLAPLSSMSASNDDTQAVNDYLSSRDVMERLIREANLLELLSRPEADFLARFPRDLSRSTHEALFERFDDFVLPYFDSSTGISTLYVYAFRPEDARQIARASLTYGEELINRLSDRARNDNVTFARQMLAEAEKKVRGAQQRVTDFRTREGLLDPVRQGVAIIELIAKMNGEVAQLKADLEEVSANSPSSPKITATKARIRALELQIGEQRPLLAGGDQALAPKVAEYEELTLDLELAVKLFASSLLTFEDAIRDAEQQRLYLERVVEPNLPDFPLYPKRIQSILKILGLSVCIYLILSALGSLVMEHDP
jgi:capsular polysaccharide transport system permease protein